MVRTVRPLWAQEGKLYGCSVLAVWLAVCSMAGCAGRPPGASAERTPGSPQSVPSNDSRPAEPVSYEALTSQDVYFPLHSVALSDEAKAILEQKVAWLMAHPTVIVQIEGHCDEPGTEIYNLALGERRADAVKRSLVERGIAPWRLTTISYGRQRPQSPAPDDAARARNRRAHFIVTNP